MRFSFVQADGAQSASPGAENARAGTLGSPARRARGLGDGADGRKLVSFSKGVQNESGDAVLKGGQMARNGISRFGIQYDRSRPALGRHGVEPTKNSQHVIQSGVRVDVIREHRLYIRIFNCDVPRTKYFSLSFVVGRFAADQAEHPAAEIAVLGDVSDPEAGLEQGVLADILSGEEVAAPPGGMGETGRVVADQGAESA
jgi:hypothetical protein